LIPIRAARDLTTKVPNPLIAASSPFFRALLIASKIPSTTA